MNAIKVILAVSASVLVMAQARAQLVVIVSAQNPNSAMTVDNAEKIFMGKIKQFANGSSAIPLDLPKGAERDAFYEKLTSKTPTQLKSYWARIIFTGAGVPPKEAESAQALVKLVAQNPNTVGYVDKALVDPSVKVVLQIP